MTVRTWSAVRPGGERASHSWGSCYRRTRLAGDVRRHFHRCSEPAAPIAITTFRRAGMWSSGGVGRQSQCQYYAVPVL